MMPALRSTAPVRQERTAAQFFRRLSQTVRRHGRSFGPVGYRYHFDIEGAGRWVVDFSAFTVRRGTAECDAGIRATSTDFEAFLNGRPPRNGGVQLTGDPASLEVLVRFLVATAA